MDKLNTNGDLRRLIATELGVDDETHAVNEAYVAQPKQFDLKTKRLSQQTKDGHISLYKGYVGKFNESSAALDGAKRAESNAAGSEFRALKEIETYTLNSVYLHELYFANIGDAESVLYTDTMAHMRLDRDFGGVQRWQEDFIACAMAAREGWVVCYLNTYLKRYVNVFIDGDSQNVPVGCVPVIVLDVWAHSYARDYAIDRKKYVKDMMSELNWRVIEDRFERAERVVEALK